MLFRAPALEGIAAGTITLAFRRWRRPAAVAGRAHRTPIGLVRIEAVEPLEPADVSDEDARRAGYADATALLADLPEIPGGRLYRIALRPAGADPRIGLAAEAALLAVDRGQIAGRLARMDAGPRGPWTAAALRVIAARPGVRAGDLAAELGRDRDLFKRDVRRLKELGLATSLTVGHRLSPRGRSYSPRPAFADRAARIETCQTPTRRSRSPCASWGSRIGPPGRGAGPSRSPAACAARSRSGSSGAIGTCASSRF